MSKRRLNPLARLIASLFFGISVLAFFGFVSTEMATHFFQGVAEDTIRQAFRKGPQANDGGHYDAVCRKPDAKPGNFSECDPDAVKGERSLRSASCSGRSFMHLFGRPWTCVARFTDGTALDVRVSLSLGSHHLELGE